MAFAERMLQLSFSGASSGTLQISGLRTYVSIQAMTGELGVSAQLKVWGLSLDQMNNYSSKISAGVGIDEFTLVIEAGDVGGQLSQVVNGSIWRSYPDFQDAPDSAFNVSVAGTIYAAATPMASQSQAGAQSAVTLIQSICNLAGLTLVNNGASGTLRNQLTYGSPIQQIMTIADAAGFSVYFEGNTVSIWPRGQSRDSTVIDIGPDTGMVGYPAWWEAGLIVQNEFNQDIQVGRQVNLTSSIPKAQGSWQIIQVQHDLATMLRKGPWFTTAVLAPVGSA